MSWRIISTSSSLGNLEFEGGGKCGNIPLIIPKIVLLSPFRILDSQHLYNSVPVPFSSLLCHFFFLLANLLIPTKNSQNC
eukprot:11995086-Ditylum_brightwellii.AAC.1